MNESPKQRFKSDKAACKAHIATVDSPVFRRAADAAMLQLVSSLPVINDLADAAAQYNRVIGARLFLTELVNIANETPPSNRRDSVDNLEGNR